MAIKHIFFDLDNTLWDFDCSSMITFRQLYNEFKLKESGIPNAEQFHHVYMGYNDDLWDLYRKGLIDKSFLKTERFRLPLADFGINDIRLSHDMGEYYTTYAPHNVALVNGAIDILDYLKQHYHIHLITNGFADVQKIKIHDSGIEDYIDSMTVSEEINIKKPDTRLFHHALNKVSAKTNESIMIGDDLKIDILPAKSIGMSQIYFNKKHLLHDEDVDYEIDDLLSINNIL